MDHQSGTPSFHKNIHDPRFLLIYPPLQFRPEDSAKPDGSLALPYLAGSLRDYGCEVAILDACAGTEKYAMKDSFLRQETLPNGFLRIGMSADAIAAEMDFYDVIGITSIFTAQTSRVIEMVRLAKRMNPSKLVMLGGVNARHLASRFFAAGADIVCHSESELTVRQIADVLRDGSKDFSRIPGISFRSNGCVHTNPQTFVEMDLDNLPVPAWDLLPLKRYWEIARPHGGGFRPEDYHRFASMMTSRGCPFECQFCHISKELEGSNSGNIRRLRMKSVERVFHEIDVLQELGVNYIFIEDDTLLAKKPRAMKIFQEIKKRHLHLSDINGVNLVHMFKKVGSNLVVDRELMIAMVEAGFRELTMPFESGSQRILNKYATGKLDLSLDLISLIRTAKEFGLKVGGNYTFGYPDETHEEVTETLLLAKSHVEAGLDKANVFIIQPFPGTVLHDEALRKGHIQADFDPDLMNWMYPSMKGTLTSPDVLTFVSQACFRLLNKPPLLQQLSTTRAENTKDAF